MISYLIIKIAPVFNGKSSKHSTIKYNLVLLDWSQIFIGDKRSVYLDAYQIREDILNDLC